MQQLALLVAIGLLGGVAVSIQSPLASIIGQRLGALESVFIVHLGGALFAGIIMLMMGGSHLGEWRSVPWYALCAGIFGLIVIGAVTVTIPRLGAATTVILIVAGQLIISALIDQFGLLGTTVRPIDLSRLGGIVLLFLGAWLMVRS